MARSAVRRASRSRCRCGSSTSPWTPPSSACSAARSASCGLVRERAGHAFDPEVAACLVGRRRGRSSRSTRSASVWEETLACEPQPPLLLEGEELDRGLAAMGNFADLISPYLAGHSAGVAELAAAAARALPDRRRRRHRAPAGGARPRPRAGRGPPADLAEARAAERGRVGAGAAAPVPHPSGCSSRSAFLAALAPVAGAHHERLDGSGYHRGAAGAELRASRTPARGRRRVPRDDRAAPAPGADRARTRRRRSWARRPAPDGSTPTR